jgi:hypothetical protein
MERESGYRLSAVGYRHEARLNRTPRIRALRFAICMLHFAIAFTTAAPLAAQVLDEAPTAGRLQFGPPDKIRIQVGAEITATRGACRNVTAYVAVPLECPEQTVELVSEDFSPEVANVDFRTLQNGARQMVISVPRLAAGETARAVVTYDVSSRTILPPEKTDDLTIPQRLTRDIRPFVGGSPYIEVKHPKIRTLAKEIVAGLPEDATAWEKVEAIYDFVLDHIEYVEGPDKGAIDTLRDAEADCQGRSMLFIALCRSNKIPARMVWVDGHAYAEFYLEDAEGTGHWFPIESAGDRAFGEMPLARTILQKGDNFRVPERPTERLRYASDYMLGLPAGNKGGRPKVTFIRQQVPN